MNECGDESGDATAGWRVGDLHYALTRSQFRVRHLRARVCLAGNLDAHEEQAEAERHCTLKWALKAFVVCLAINALVQPRCRQIIVKPILRKVGSVDRNT